MPLRAEQINGLTCHILDTLPPATPPRTVVVLCHGFGAPGTDLIPIGQFILKHPQLAASVQFLFPEAPLSLDDLGLYGGRAWWPIDMRRLQMAAAVGTFQELRKDCPAELPAARAALRGLIDAWSERSGLSLDRFILGGFSQGAMLATEVTLQSDQNPAGLIILSGALIHEPTWRDRAAHHPALRVLQSHGTEDPVLPFQTAGWLRDLLQRAGADVEFLPFEGGHEIPYEVLNRFTAFVRASADDEPGAR